MTRAWLMVALLCLVAFLNNLDRLMITTMRGSIMEAIPMTEAQFGLLTSAFLWIYALLSPFAGFIADRFSRSKVIIGSLLAWSVVTWLTSHAKTFEQLLLARALMGVSEAFYIPAALALIVDYHRGPTRSLAVGVHGSGFLFGAAMGGIGGVIAESHSWTYAYWLFGIIGVIYAVVLAFLLKDPENVSPALKEDAGSVHASAPAMSFVEAVTSLFRLGSFNLMLVFWGLIGLTGWAIVGWMPTYLNEQFRLRQGVAGLSATGYIQIASMLGQLIGGAWADRWSRKTERGRIFVPVIGLCIAAPAVFLISQAGLLPLAIIGMVVYGITRSFTDANFMPILCLVADPRCRATGFGILNFFACVVGGLSIYLGGALRDAQFNVSILFQLAALSLLVCAVLLYFVKATKRDYAGETSRLPTNDNSQPNAAPVSAVEPTRGS